MQSEKVLTYSIVGSDTILERTTVVSFNELGFTLAAVSYSESSLDTHTTLMKYDSNRITGWIEFLSGENDTTVFQAVGWNERGRGTKFIELGEEGS